MTISFSYKKYVWLCSFCLFITCCVKAQLIDFKQYVHKKNDTIPMLFAPVADIEWIEKANKSDFSDSLSERASVNLTGIAHEMKSNIGYDSIWSWQDTALIHTMQYEMKQLIQQINENPGQKEFPTPPLMDSLLTETQKSYGLIIYQNGFTRRKGNYSGQVWKSIGIGVLTMGSYYEVPYKSLSNMYVFKLDASKKVIWCLNKHEAQDKEPLDENFSKKQMGKLFATKSGK